MKNRTIILSEEQISGLIEITGDFKIEYGLKPEEEKALAILEHCLSDNQDTNYQAIVRYNAYLEWGNESAGLIPEFDVGTFPGEHILEFGKIMSLGLRNLDFEMDGETEYDLSRWANECLIAGLDRQYGPEDWMPKYKEYELVKARGVYKKGSDDPN